MIAQEHIADGDVQRWLHSVGVESLCQLEVLTFLYRHRVTLLPPEYLARLLGYGTESVLAALDSLASLDLLERSPQSKGGRAYQFIAQPLLSRNESLQRLLVLSGDRSGRLLIGKHLGRGHDTAREELLAARQQFLADADAVLGTIILRFCGRSSEPVH